MKNNTILIVIGIILVGALFYTSQVPEEDFSLNVHYYQDGIEIFPEQNFFTIVNPPGESYDQIAFDIPVTNLDIPITNMQIVDAYPLVFKYALPTTAQTLESGETKILWTSGLMDTIQFESISPVNFWIKISGYDTFNKETIYSESYSGDISFEAESSSPTQTFFGNLFSIIDIGGQTYHTDRIDNVRFGSGTTATLVDYSGSGYFTGMYVSGTRSDVNCKIFIDGIKYLDESSQQRRTVGCAFYSVEDYNTVRFENSLKIQCAPSAATNYYVSSVVSYMTD